jgi:hypothetical protein
MSDDCEPDASDPAPDLLLLAIVSIARPPLLEPMHATLGHALVRGGRRTYEPKDGGLRVVADVSAFAERTDAA